MNLQERINLLSRLGEYIQSDNKEWHEAKEKASWGNGWFIPEFVELAAKNIATAFLQKDALTEWVNRYSQLIKSRGHPADNLPILRQAQDEKPKTVGIVMAGNIPLVGFHDMLCVFIAGHKANIKVSSKDKELITHLVNTLAIWNEEIRDIIIFSDMLKGCDAYIATGSNNSSGYFEYYFGKYPHIIRRNRTSVAILAGNETNEELSKLADDIYLYFGLGCRNVTKIYTPAGYDFIPLLTVFKKYNYLADNHKYKNNYDYNLAIHLLNNKYYMTNGSILLVENEGLFSPISQLHYQFYSNENEVRQDLLQNENVQCIVSKKDIYFGEAQCPQLFDYADGVDTLQFLKRLTENEQLRSLR